MAEVIQNIDLSALDRFGSTEKILAMMEPHIHAALSIVKGAVRERTPVGAKGLLRNSITYEWSQTGLTGMGRLYAYGKAGEYAPYVEYGRMPGKYPPWGIGSALFEWVKVKVRSAEYKASAKKPKAITRTSKTKGTVVTQEGARILSISFLIARHIARFGTYEKGAPHMFELAWEESKDQAMQIVNDGIQEVFEALSK